MPIGDLLEALLGRHRLSRRAEGRAHDRGPGPRGEPRRARRGRARVRRRRCRARPGGAGCIPAGRRPRRRRRHAPRRRGPRHAHDAAHAKGLEYPIVFIAGMEEGVFPHARSLDEGGLEEERRLVYVGITRAMRELYLTRARRRAVFGAPQYGLRSRFLDEIPFDLTDRKDEPRRGAARRARARSGRDRGRRHRAPGRAAVTSASATTSSTPPSARAWSPPWSLAGSSSCASRATAASASSWPSTRRSPGAEQISATVWVRAMPAEIIDGKAGRRRDVREARRARGRGVPASSSTVTGPGLATILVGDDPGSAVYVAGKQKACKGGRHGTGFNHPLPADTSRDGAHRAHRAPQRRTTRVHGILLQLPLPEAPRRRRAHRPSSTRQGRQRPHARQRRPARARDGTACGRARRRAACCC